MHYVEIGTSAAVVSPAKINQCLQQITSAPRPIFVHCRAGRDRTGLEIAMYRIVVQGWTRQRAIGELYAHGYNWMLYPGIERYLKTFPNVPQTLTTSGG
jgi:protein tyrosine/serine phosphatase